MDKRTCFFITLLLLILSLFSCPQKTTMRNVKFMAYDEQENKYIQKGNTILVKDGDKFSTTQNQRPTVQDVKVDNVDYKHIHWTLPSVPPTEDSIMTEGQAYSEDTQINSDITLYAVYKEDTKKVTFKSFKQGDNPGYENFREPITVTKGTLFKDIPGVLGLHPEDITGYKGRDYSFKHWTSTAPTEATTPDTTDTKIDENTQIQEDITLYAVYNQSALYTYTVTFKNFIVETNSRYEKIGDSVTVDYGKTLNDISTKPTPSDLAIEDFDGHRYAFVCWSETSPNPENKPIINATAFDNNTPITKELTLYAVYSQGGTNTRTVTFMGFEVGENSGYKKLGNSITVDYGKTLNDISTKPTPSNLNDYKGFRYAFNSCWNTEAPTPESGPQTITNFGDATPITKDLILYAVYTKGSVNTRTVTFMGFKVGESSGYEQLDGKTVDYGKKLNDISDRPTPSDITNYKGHNYTFRFWSKTKATGDNPSTTLSEFDNTTSIEEDIILYAVYRDGGENKYTVTFKSFDDNDNSYQLIEAATKTEVRYQEKFNNVKPAVNPGKATIGGVEYTFLGWCEEQQPSSIIEHFQKDIIYDNPEITESKTYCAVYMGDYLCFKADEDDGAQISFDFVGGTLFGDDEISLQYREDGEKEFKPYKWTIDGEQKESVKSAAEGLTITLSQKGSSVYFKGDNKKLASGADAYLNFKIKNNKEVSASGSVMSLVESRSEIPAQNCFNSLFKECKKLTSAPKLPATTLASMCYQNMFQYCELLTEAPDLPAETLSEYCYNAMFYGCKKLTTAPLISAKTLANNCCASMFVQCVELESAPILLAETLVNRCYAYMFASCRKLKSVTCYGKTGISASNYSLSGWLDGVASGGTFYCLEEVKSSWEYTTVSQIPEDWSFENITTE